VSKLWSERENQQDATVRCLFLTISQHVTFTVLAPYKTAPHNCYQPHPAEPAQHTTCSNIRLVLLKMGIMMPKTCWEIVKNKHLTVASCWFSLSLRNEDDINTRNASGRLLRNAQTAIRCCVKIYKEKKGGRESSWTHLCFKLLSSIILTVLYFCRTIWYVVRGE